MKFAITLSVLLATASAALTKSQIEAINSDPSSTWQATEDGPFKGWSKEQLRGLMGTRTKPHNASAPRRLSNINMRGLPTSFDSRLKWSRCPSIQQIRDQGDCGSCWAFGATEAFTDRYCIASNQTQNPIFGTETLVACSDLDFGCNGGTLSTAWMYLERHGLPLETCQPYTAKDDTTPACKWGTCTGTGSWKTWHVKDVYWPGCGFMSCSPDAMAADIMANGPIEAAFTVYEDFMHYKSGVYVHKTGEELGGHAIKILGWGVEGNTPYWLVANSWNTSWGDKGFFKILRGSNECGIESDTAAGHPLVVKA